MKITAHVVEAVGAGVAIVIAGVWIIVYWLPEHGARVASADAQAASDAELASIAGQGNGPLSILGAGNPYGDLGSAGAQATVTPGSGTSDTAGQFNPDPVYVPPAVAPTFPGGQFNPDPVYDPNTGGIVGTPMDDLGNVWTPPHPIPLPVPQAPPAPPPQTLRAYLAANPYTPLTANYWATHIGTPPDMTLAAYTATHTGAPLPTTQFTEVAPKLDVANSVQNL